MSVLYTYYFNYKNCFVFHSQYGNLDALYTYEWSTSAYFSFEKFLLKEILENRREIVDKFKELLSIHVV